MMSVYNFPPPPPPWSISGGPTTVREPDPLPVYPELSWAARHPCWHALIVFWALLANVAAFVAVVKYIG